MLALARQVVRIGTQPFGKGRHIGPAAFVDGADGQFGITFLYFGGIGQAGGDGVIFGARCYGIAQLPQGAGGIGLGNGEGGIECQSGAVFGQSRAIVAGRGAQVADEVMRPFCIGVMLADQAAGIAVIDEEKVRHSS